MLLTAILVTCALSTQPLPSTILFQSTPSQPSAPVSEQSPATAQPAPASPCPASAQSTRPPGCKPAVPSKDKKKKHTQPAAHDASKGPTKTIIRNGSTTDPTVTISTALSDQQASQQLQKTNQMLAATDENLKRGAGRSLTSAQEDTVMQIKSYTEQARTAAAGGDVQRAYNLASKAKMLSADLAGH